MNSRNPGPSMFAGLVVLATVLAAGPAVAQDRPVRQAPVERPRAVKPDLVVEDITFQIVKQKKDAHGKPCMIFNLRPVIANRGGATFAPFRVVVQWNKGPGGVFQQACPLCQWEVKGMAAGEKRTLDPRQFNNCGAEGLKFRVYVDPDSQVQESNENNNHRVEAPTFFVVPPKLPAEVPAPGKVERQE